MVLLPLTHILGVSFVVVRGVVLYAHKTFGDSSTQRPFATVARSLPIILLVTSTPSFKLDSNLCIFLNGEICVNQK